MSNNFDCNLIMHQQYRVHDEVSSLTPSPTIVIVGYSSIFYKYQSRLLITFDNFMWSINIIESTNLNIRIVSSLYILQILHQDTYKLYGVDMGHDLLRMNLRKLLLFLLFLRIKIFEYHCLH